MLLTTQYLEEADQLADRVAIIDHGKIVKEGTPTDLKAAVGAPTLLISVAAPQALISAATFSPDSVNSGLSAGTSSNDDVRLGVRIPGARVMGRGVK